MVDAEPHAPTGAVRDHEGGCWPSRALCTSAARVLGSTRSAISPDQRSWRTRATTSRERRFYLVQSRAVEKIASAKEKLEVLKEFEPEKL